MPRDLRACAEGPLASLGVTKKGGSGSPRDGLGVTGRGKSPRLRSGGQKNSGKRPLAHTKIAMDTSRN